MARLRKAKVTTRRANDILRACGLTAAPLDDPGVVKDLIKVIERKALSPVLVVGGGTRSDIADGFSGSRWCTGSTRTGGVPLKLTDVGRTPTQADHGGRERVARRASFRGSQVLSPRGVTPYSIATLEWRTSSVQRLRCSSLDASWRACTAIMSRPPRPGA